MIQSANFLTKSMQQGTHLRKRTKEPLGPSLVRFICLLSFGFGANKISSVGDASAVVAHMGSAVGVGVESAIQTPQAAFRIFPVLVAG
jgi:hypothetical protein